MTTVTLRMPDNMLHIIDVNAYNLHLSRSEYIKKAVLELNLELERAARKDRLMAASQKVRQESMLVNAEFESIEYDPKD